MVGVGMAGASRQPAVTNGALLYRDGQLLPHGDLRQGNLRGPEGSHQPPIPRAQLHPQGMFRDCPAPRRTLHEENHHNLDARGKLDVSIIFLIFFHSNVFKLFWNQVHNYF